MTELFRKRNPDRIEQRNPEEKIGWGIRLVLSILPVTLVIIFVLIIITGMNAT